jgi:hypothetical protein
LDPVPTYRLYILDASDGVVAGQIIECADDAEARAKARPYVDGRAVELWQDGRLVLRVEGKPE